ncbi:MAG: 23S rRNA (pseudouridine(1915)-N(3))-methyltransferase RlmH [Paludibacter sp.]|nr:23S rRNA (pseudouridine(1915)-N(3))-methyltransferase RlmH [Paludibacter sp.]
MKITLLMVGKSNHPQLIKLEEEYRNRLKHYTAFDVQIVPELKNAKNLSEQEQKEKEADLLQKYFDAQDEVVLLDERGKQFSSVGFADFIEKKNLSSLKRMIFVVGGPYGFSQRIYDRANQKISLSAMTFSHQMIRVIFMEQLYRAYTIIRGEPYHHE